MWRDVGTIAVLVLTWLSQVCIMNVMSMATSSGRLTSRRAMASAKGCHWEPAFHPNVVRYTHIYMYECVECVYVYLYANLFTCGTQCGT